MEKNEKNAVVQYYNSLKKILELQPKNVDVLIQIGVLDFEYFHRHQEAVDFFRTAIKCDPENVNARFWLATCLYHDYCEYESAKQILREALELDPNRPDCLSLLASISWHEGDPLEDAISYLRRAVESAPDWPLLRHKLATLLLESHQMKLAEEEISKALSSAKALPSPIQNEVDNYYENTVTGRAWPSLIDEFKELSERIKTKS